MENRKEALITQLKSLYQLNENEIKIALAPGRVNLIGGHTDYNMGFVLPCAVDKDTMIAAVPNQTETVNLYSMTLEESRHFQLNNFKYNPEDRWINYAKGISFYLKERGYKIGGINGALHATVPIGSGMSSSAALEVSIGYIFNLLFNLGIPAIELIKIAYQAEREFLGVMCGIMDQYVSVRGVKNSVIFIDCRSLNYEVIKIPRQDIKVVILHTNVKRAAGSALNQRKEECFEAVRLFQKENPNIEALRDVSIEYFEKKKEILPPTLRKRAEHIVYENQRVIDAKNALKEGDLETVGALMYKSHKSLAELYEVSIKELDIMLEIAKKHPGVVGSRMTGAGLGGAVVCLVEKEHAESLIKEVMFKYPKLADKSPIIYDCEISDGVRQI